MRKLYLFFAVLCSLLGAQTANASFSGNWTIYLYPGCWDTDGAYYVLYVSGNNDLGAQWVEMTDVDGDGYYSATVPNGDWVNLDFVRMNPSTSFSSLTSSNFWSVKWNDTGYITDVAYKGNCVKITGWGDSHSTFEWSNYTPTVAASDYYLIVNGTSYGFTSTGTNSDGKSCYEIEGGFTFPSGETSGTMYVQSNSGTTFRNNGSVSAPFSWDMYSSTESGLTYSNLTSTYSVTLRVDSSSQVHLTFEDATPETEIEVSADLNMPLKKSDFVDANGNGKAHYFVVGTRMSEWRLQPEWELLDTDGDGTYTLANRFLYTGMMGIAKVDSYDDYIYQRYTFYSYNTNVTGDKELTLTTKTNPNASLLAVTCAESTNKFTAVNYGKSYTKGQFTSSNTIIWGSSLTEDGIRLSQPTYVGTISIKDNGDEGLTLTFSDSSSDASVIANYRTFSLVGSAVVNVDYNSDETCKTPLRNDGSGPTDWQEAWIQYDNYGKPYYDAYGNSLYQTVFQREWLANHPTIFKAEDGFEYNSLNIVFNYDASQTHSATIPATGEYGWATDNGSVTSPNKSYSVTNNDGWQCFVVENMWLVEQFKIWTGWGGADKTQDGSGIGSGDARWNYDNGGHHTGADWTISADKTIYYGTDRDINKADFDLGDRIFARYVKVWWNPSQGFDGSFLQLITEVGGPEISCARADKHALQYTWTVPNAATQLADYDVKNIKIVRYRLDSNKNETSIVISDVAYAQGDLNGADITTVAVKDQLDSNYAEGGYYWYKIVIDYYGNSTADEKSDFSRDAESNRVYIYSDVIPDAATVKQLVYTTADGTPENGTRVADDAETKYYSFDLAVNASAPASLIDATYTKDGETVDVLSLVKYYVVGVPNPNSNLYTGYSSNATLLTSSDLSAWTDLNFSTDYTYFGLTPDKDNNYAMPEFVLYNVIPGSFYVATGNNFTVDMISEDGDASAWAAYNVTTAKPQTSMTVPTTSYSVKNFAIVKASETAAKAADDADTNKPLGASEAQPVSFHSFNKLQTTDGCVKQLMVTNSVLSAWNVTYGLTAAVGTTSIDNINLQYDNASVNSTAGVAANFDYLPVAYTSATRSLSTGIDEIDSKEFRWIDAEDFKYGMTVNYTRTSGNVSVDAEETTGKVAINPVNPVDGGNVTNYDQLLAYQGTTEDNNDALNKFTVHNQSAWSSTTSDGEGIYFLDAYKAIDLINSTTLNKGVGYYSSNGHSCNTTYYKATTNAGYQPIVAVEGGEVITGDGYEAPFNALYAASYGDDDNFSEKAVSVGILPIKIGHIGEGEEGVASVDNLPDFNTVYTVLTAEYPFLVKPALVSSVSEASDEDAEDALASYSMVTLAYPSTVYAKRSDTTTDINDIAADVAGDFRIWPNPAVDVVNVAASAALGTIEIYAVDGRLVKTVEVDDTHAALEVSDLVKGTYIVRAAGATQRMIKK